MTKRKRRPKSFKRGYNAGKLVGKSPEQIARSIARKQAKKLFRQANTRMRKIGKSTLANKHNPAIKQYLKQGKRGQVFGFGGASNKWQENRAVAEASKFMKSETSTKKGAKKVLGQTVKNILGGGGKMTEADVKKYNDFKVLIENPDLGESLVENYYDVYYKVKDLISGEHTYVSSDDIMSAITEKIESKEIIKDMQDESSITENPDGSATVQFATYLDLMDSAELAQSVVDDLLG